MSKTDNKRSIIVAIFVLLGLVILIAAIFILGGQQNQFARTINLTAVFDNVGGLSKGNNIWFSGVKVGTVRKITFHGKSDVEVIMRIEEDAQEYIRKDSKVRLASESLIGNRILEIYGGSADAPMAEDGDRLEVVSSSGTDDMMATLQENNQNILSITEDLKNVMGNINRGEGTVGAILSDEKAAADFRKAMDDLQRITANTAQASVEINRFTTKLNSPDGLANKLVTDTTVFRQLSQTVQELKQVAASASAITADIKDATDQLNKTNNAVGTLLNDEQFAERLKSTMQNLESGSKKLDENMEALQRTWLLRGAFKKD